MKENYNIFETIFIIKQIVIQNKKNIDIYDSTSMKLLLLNSLDYVKNPIIYQVIDSFFLKNANKIGISYKDINFNSRNLRIVKRKNIEYKVNILDFNKNFIVLDYPAKLLVLPNDKLKFRATLESRIIEFESVVKNIKIDSKTIIIDLPHKVYIVHEKKVYHAQFSGVVYLKSKNANSEIGFGIDLRFKDALINLYQNKEYKDITILFLLSGNLIKIELASIVIENKDKNIGKIIFHKVSPESETMIKSFIYRRNLMI